MKKASPIVQFTQEEWDEFVRLWNKADIIAKSYELVVREETYKKKDSNRDASGVTYIEGWDNVNKDGLWVWEMQPAHYEDGQEKVSAPVPLGFILNPHQSIQDAAIALEERRIRDINKREDWDRAQFERLKKKYETI